MAVCWSACETSFALEGACILSGAVLDMGMCCLGDECFFKYVVERLEREMSKARIGLAR